MKLEDAARFLKEKDDEDKGKAPPVTGGDTISTKQAAEELGRTVSRVRQLVNDKTLKTKVSPRPGDRDHEILLKDVQQLKNNMPKKGRPSDNDADGEEEGSKGKKKGKKDDNDKGAKD